MSPPNIRTRLARIEVIARLFEGTSGSGRLDIATDLLADLEHWCRQERVDFDLALRRAQTHFEAENDHPF